MGCDIHPLVQVKRNEKWEHEPFPDGTWRGPFRQRDYIFFGVLAGVRCHDVTPIAEPRGLPDDLDYEVNEDGYVPALLNVDLYDDEIPDCLWLGEHSYSWVTLAELDAYPWEEALMQVHTNGWDDTSWTREHLAQLAGDTFPWLRSLGAPDDVRVVFGFDS